MSAYRRNSRPFATIVSPLSQESKTVFKENKYKHSSASSLAVSSFCCSALLRTSKKQSNNQSPDNYKKEINLSEYNINQELITPEYGNSFSKRNGNISPKRALLTFGQDGINNNYNGNFFEYDNKGESIIIPAISTPKKGQITYQKDHSAMESSFILPTRCMFFFK